MREPSAILRIKDWFSDWQGMSPILFHMPQNPLDNAFESRSYLKNY